VIRSIRRYAAALAVATMASALVPAGAAASSLQQRLATVVAQSGVAANSSVYVWDQSSREVVYARVAGRSVTPASTIKLMTTAAALSRLGPEHRFQTRIALDGTQTGDTFDGDVWLIGGGDPSLSTFGFRRDNYGGVGSNIAGLLTPLRNRGITHVTGRVRVDDGMFDQQRWVGEWNPSFRYYYSGPLGALTVNQGYLGSWRGGQASRNPDIHAGETLRTLMGRNGITVGGSTMRGSLPESAKVVGTLASPPLHQLAGHTNAASDNFFAEILLKHVGVARFGSRSDGSTDQGRRAARAQLVEMGMSMEGVRWVDGSGLAYDNRVTARSIGHTLGVGAQAEWGEQWIQGFATSGRSGTLRNRMTTRPFYGRVQGKTGTLRHASGLAGFSQRVGSNRRYGFVVLTYDPRGRPLQYTLTRALQDRLAMTLVR
jgi:serine-type D-Ala-D-Ala carboxypeptidase/endopeptidase (penicillin-binding protein 4)